MLAQNAPHLAYVLPAGGRQGATFQVTTGGQFLPNVSEVYVSGSGVQATVVDYARPMNAMQATELRDRMQELQKQTMTAAVRKEMVDTRVKLLLFNARQAHQSRPGRNRHAPGRHRSRRGARQA